MRRRIKTLEVSPQEIGLCGCWQIAAVERATIDLTKPKAQQLPQTEIACYVTSRPQSELDNKAMLDAIVGHWAGIENGVHRTRDVTLGEDACRVGRPKRADIDDPKVTAQRRNAARNLVTLRNFAIGLYNLLRHKNKTKAPSLASWRRSMTTPEALAAVLR